jgi:subfamily B ATP-binding cassette protein HlyB/CyaB
MTNQIEYKNRLLELRDKSILFWLKEENKISIIEKFKFSTFTKGQFIHEKVNLQDFVILLSGKANLISLESNSLKESIIPGRSFELGNYILEKPRSYKWLADDDTVIATIEFSVLKDFLTESGNYEYLKRISTVVELQKFKNDLRMLGVPNTLTKDIIGQLKQDDEGPKENELCILSFGSLTFFNPTDETEVKKLKISDYLIWKDTDIPFDQAEHTAYWKLPSSFGLDKKIDPSILAFFDVIAEIKTKISIPHEEESTDFADEPEDLEDFEISHFQVTNKMPLLKTKKKPVALRQHDTMDCGAACMAMIAQFYKREISLGTWRRLIHITREGASMLSIKTAADSVGFDSIGIMSGSSSLKSFTTPFIALMAYHYVVVYKMTEDHVTIADPARGLVTIGMEEFKKDYSNNCLLMRPNKKLLSYPESPPAYKKYLSLFKPHYSDFLQIVLFSSLLFILSLAPPLFIQYIFDTVIPSGKADSMKVISIAAIVFAIFIMLLSIIRLSFLIKIASIISLKLSSLFFRQILKLPFGYFTVRNVGDITTRVDELDKIRAFFTNDSIKIFLSVLAIFIYSSILIVYHSYFTYLILFSIITVTFIMSPLAKKIKQLSQDLFHSLGGAQSITYEQFSSLRTIQNITGSMQARWRWEEKQAKVLDKRQKIEFSISYIMSISSIVQQVMSLAFLTLAIYLFLERKITIGQVVASTTISGMIIDPLLSLIQSLDNIGQLKVSFEKIDEIVTSKVEEAISSQPFPTDFKTIEFKDVWFKYGSDFNPWILKGLNLQVKRGQRIAFVGPSGSGKSTASYMLNLIYAAQKGDVLFDGIKNTDINLDDLRANISMIVQDNSVLMGTVLSNIALGDPSPDLAKANNAARLAEAHDFIMSLPEGYQTMIGGEHGTSMSGGQKQRISIARAIYKNPSIIIMDEATSALDTITEKKVMSNLYQNLRGTTCFIIAHRFNTIMSADVIVVVKEGKIKELGSHDDLMKKQSIYYNMFRKQINL